MSRLRAIFEVSFRAKVLVPVIFVMVLLLTVTAWVVDRRITRQFEAEATRALAAADEGFRDWQANRAKNLLLRFADLRNEPRYKAAFQTGDAPTVRAQLADLLNSSSESIKIVLFSATRQEVMASAKRDPLIPLADFAANSAAAVEHSLHGEEKVDTILVDGKLYEVVSIPAFDSNGDVCGALTFGLELNREAAVELSRFTRSEVVLLANTQVIVKTIEAADANARFAALFTQLARESGERNATFGVRNEVFGGQHFCCSGGRFSSLDADSALGCLLLYSYEDSWRALVTTQQTLLAVNGLACLLGSLVVCFLVGKATRPLRELRDSVEAVGRGDFSRRVEVRYEDECGELARVFNQMTENLKRSREQLETTQAQLIQSEKLSGIGEFIAGVTHELNNPLTSIMGFSELLQQADVGPKHKEFLELVHQSARRCHKIVQALLSFARRSAPERKPTCLNELVEASLEILQYQLRTSNIEVVLSLDPRLPPALVDPHQLQQVFVNIINNARQAIEDHQAGGRVSITSAASDRCIRITIQDNGPGISKENLLKIFDPFFTTKEVGKGTGLGLSLCYGIVREHGGTISATSKPGEGAAFVIELPVASEIAAAPGIQSPGTGQAPKPNEGRGKKLLVIDDEESILRVVRETLAPRGYEVDVATDGESGLRRLSEKHYDLTLCDWKMPGLNGQQVYERLRATRPAMAERMIFITGDVINETARKFLEQQRKVCLPKPFTLAEFCDAIRKVLAAD